ncbi:ATP-binding protein [Photobacterium leiognathi subsp. mandapamensis]|uniref:ATP-binding protein n=1 Tax=Photobacterium leiognathi TaxID=553611 RepID=UPI003BF47C12
MDKIFRVSDVFTPTSPAKLTFVEREAINKRIVRALTTVGTQIVIYGQSGSGKTTLIENKLFQVYDNHIKTSCMKGMTFEAVMLDAFDQLSPYFLSEQADNYKSCIDISLKQNFSLIDTQLKKTISNEEASKYTRILPPQLTAQNLARFMGASGHCWILDDFHKVEESDKQQLSQLMKVFMDMSNEYPNLKIICVGAVNTARQVIQYDLEMKNRVAEIKVPLMTNAEIRNIAEMGFKLLNVKPKDSKMYSDIYHYSSGLPSICHKLCQLICEDLDIRVTFSKDLDVTEQKLLVSRMDKITYEHSDSASSISSSFKRAPFTNTSPNELIEIDLTTLPEGKNPLYIQNDSLTYAVSEYLDDASDTIKATFDLTSKVTYGLTVIEALSECQEEGGTFEDISDNVENLNESMTKEDVLSVLELLQTDNGGSAIVYDPDSYEYRFTTPFLLTFARTFFEHTSYRQKMSHREIMRLINSTFTSVKNTYL